MQLAWFDWVAIAVYFAANIGIGLYYRSKATASVSSHLRRCHPLGTRICTVCVVIVAA